jgi:hypothetical protein
MKDWKSKLLALAIAIVFTAFIFYGISTFYPNPQYQDFCTRLPSSEFINNSEECTEQGGAWSPGFEGRVKEGYCDLDFSCREEYDTARKNYKKLVFIVSLVFGLGTLIGGIFIVVPNVSAGLMGGGIFTMFIGIMQYWDELGDYLRFILLGIALAILIYVGIKKLK